MCKHSPKDHTFSLSFYENKHRHTNFKTLNSVNQLMVLKPIFIFENSATKISMFIYLLLIEKKSFWRGLKPQKVGTANIEREGRGGGFVKGEL